MFKFETVETRTLAGLKKAEKLQAQGWKVVSTSIHGALLMEKQDATETLTKDCANVNKCGAEVYRQGDKYCPDCLNRQLEDKVATL